MVPPQRSLHIDAGGCCFSDPRPFHEQQQEQKSRYTYAVSHVATGLALLSAIGLAENLFKKDSESSCEPATTAPAENQPEPTEALKVERDKRKKLAYSWRFKITRTLMGALGSTFLYVAYLAASWTQFFEAMVWGAMGTWSWGYCLRLWHVPEKQDWEACQREIDGLAQ